ncbi:MAG: flavodoxin family protein, partial [Patescibacteria group bacterium]
MEKVSIIGINGSPNKNGICARLLKKALMVAEKRGVKTKIVYLIDIEKKFYHSNYKKVPEEDFKKLGEEILKTDGLILATPVYWLNMSSLMKNFLEKLTVFELQGFKCEGKVAGFIATEEEEGGWQTILNMAGPLNNMGFILPPY